MNPLALLLLVAFTLLTPLRAADPLVCDWTFSGGGTTHDKTRAVTTDAAGNVFLASECVGDAAFGPFHHRTAGGMDMCLTKLDPAGQPLWVASLGGSGTDRAYGVVTDPDGNVYVTGHFDSTDAVFDDKPLPNSGDYDIFTAKFSPSGKSLWVRVKGSPGYDYGHGIAVDGQDHIYLGGNASGSGAFDKARIDAKTTAAVIVKLNPQGDAIWASVIPGTPSALYHEITCDSQGRVWGVGMFKGSVTVAEQTFKSSGEKDTDGLIVHLDASGQVQWAQHLQGPGTDYCLGVATDDRGTAFVCGDFNQDTTLAGHALVTRGSGDIFIAAFDLKGVLSWVQQAGGKLNDSAYPITYRTPGELIIAGATAAPATFGRKVVTSSGSSDLYAAKWRLSSPP